VTTGWHAERAWLGGEAVCRDVLITVRDGRIAAVEEGVPAGDAYRLPGLVVPGLANAHSHAFHRALRGRAQDPRDSAGDFWTWRAQMYAVAERLDPDSYRELATAVYAEMALAGITAVGEFHYLHHPAAGGRYDDPNAMGHALVDAAAVAGVRLTLLDTCYLTADVDGTPPAGPQLRFSDGDAAAWAQRASEVDAPVVGAAIHSVRAVPPDAMREVAEWAASRRAPLHLHLSEQRRENERCREVHGRTPTELCADQGVLGPRTTAVHATHLTPDDVRILGTTGTGACFCPTTERELADGIGPAGALVGYGSPLSLGTDSHAMIDLFEEARAVELNERLATGARGHHSADALLTAATAHGAAALGWDAGVLAPGRLADFVAVDTDSVRMAGIDDPVAAVVFAATAADVTTVVLGGHLVVEDGIHLAIPDTAEMLAATIATLTR
jgi:formiminoglutamate deiminase